MIFNDSLANGKAQTTAVVLSGVEGLKHIVDNVITQVLSPIINWNLNIVSPATINWNTHPPVITGKRIDAVKAVIHKIEKNLY